MLILFSSENLPSRAVLACQFHESNSPPGTAEAADRLSDAKIFLYHED